MPIIESKGGIRETTVTRLPNGGKVVIRQGSQAIWLDWSEAEQVLAFLHEEKQRHDTGQAAAKFQAEPQHPGEWLRQELEKRKMAPGVFAKISGCTLWEVNELIQGKIDMSVLMAQRIGAALDDGKQVIDGPLGWLHLQAAYDLANMKEPVPEY